MGHCKIGTCIKIFIGLVSYRTFEDKFIHIFIYKVTLLILIAKSQIIGYICSHTRHINIMILLRTVLSS